MPKRLHPKALAYAPALGVVLLAATACERTSPAPEAQLHAVLPSLAVVGESVRLRVSTFDEKGLPIDAAQPLAVELTAPGITTPPSLEPTGVGTVAANVIFPEAGVYRAMIRDAAGREATAGPIRIVASSEELRWRPGEATKRIYWGDAHGHSDVGDGTYPPAQYFLYARELAHLDFTCLSEHDFQQFLEVGFDPDPGSWDRIAKEANAWRTSEFAVFLGWEWSSRVHGHRVVLFPDDASRYVSFQSEPTPRQLASALEGTGAFSIIAHPSGSQLTPAINWDTVVPGFDRAIEIYSGHGTMDGDLDFRPTTAPKARSSALDALRWGFHYAIVAFSDTHLSTPGNPGPPPIRDAPYRGGMTAVYAPNATQAEIFAALRDGHCYATSGERFLVEFRAEGRSIGETVSVSPTQPVVVKGLAAAATSWTRIEIMRDDDLLEIVEEAEGQSEVRFERSVGPFEHDAALWLRGASADGERFWTTPVWVTVEK